MSPQWLGHKYIDYSFQNKDQLYVWWVNDFLAFWNSNFDLATFQNKFRPLSEIYTPVIPLFWETSITEAGHWKEVSQGSLGNCYFIAAMIEVGSK